MHVELLLEEVEFTLQELEEDRELEDEVEREDMLLELDEEFSPVLDEDTLPCDDEPDNVEVLLELLEELLLELDCGGIEELLEGSDELLELSGTAEELLELKGEFEEDELLMRWFPKLVAGQRAIKTCCTFGCPK